jgi:hypothetical protein
MTVAAGTVATVAASPAGGERVQRMLILLCDEA